LEIIIDSEQVIAQVVEYKGVVNVTPPQAVAVRSTHFAADIVKDPLRRAYYFTISSIEL
jgi:hypothetical protein